MELSPLENAIEFVKDGIAALKSQVRRLKNGETTSSNQLTMKLQGILDAAVAGGLKNYEVHTYVRTSEYCTVYAICREVVVLYTMQNRYIGTYVGKVVLTFYMAITGKWTW